MTHHPTAPTAVDGHPGTATDAPAALAAQTERLRRDPAALPVLFAAAARTLGRGASDPSDPDGLLGPRVEDTHRRALLIAWREAVRDAEGDHSAVATLRDLYDHGDADERRAILRALPDLDVGDRALDLVRDALRTNDTRLVAAAVGPYAQAHLPQEEWRHAVLKCLFVEVPLAAVDGLAERTDDELVRMAGALAAEREAAGRAVSDDTRRLLALDPTTGSTTTITKE